MHSIYKFICKLFYLYINSSIQVYRNCTWNVYKKVLLKCVYLYIIYKECAFICRKKKGIYPLGRNVDRILCGIVLKFEF